MNSRIFKIMMVFSLFVLLGSAGNAQGLTTNMRLIAQVPFDFKLGDIAMPEGKYDLTKLNLNSAVIKIQGEDNVAVRIAMPMYASGAREQSVLIFNKYQESGNEVSYFLTKIWVAGDSRGFEFPTTRAERAAALRAARRDIITLVVQRANVRAE